MASAEAIWASVQQDLPAWLGAIGVILVLFLVLLLWRSDKRRARRDRAGDEAAHVKRLVAGFRAEIGAAIQSAKRRQDSAGETLAGVEWALKGGATVDTKAPHPGTMVITEGIIYRALAPELAALPPELIRQIVKFYDSAQEATRTAESARNAIQAYQIMHSLCPRIRMSGHVLLALFDEYERRRFPKEIEFYPSAAQIAEWARETGQPLGELSDERSMGLSARG